MKYQHDKYDFEHPRSLQEARARIDTITVGILNVEKQLGDVRREHSMGADEYEAWRERTKAARIFLVAEQRFLKEWVHERRRLLLAKDSQVWPGDDPRSMLRRAVLEGRKHLRGERNQLIAVLDSIDLYLTHDA